MTSFTYHIPTKVIFNENALINIDNYIGGRKTIVITSNSFVQRGIISELYSYTNNIVKIISNIKSHPEFCDLEEIYKEIYKEKFDLIIALGGGSVLDSAKYFSVFSINKKASFVTKLIKGQIAKKDYSLIPIISIPTTSGTGSELTPWATIWDSNEKKKYSLHLKELSSELAIYDPLLTVSLPKEITIQTSLDTLSHALESIWNKNANEITISYAIKSSKLVLEYLPLLVKDLNNIYYRKMIMKACMYAALAFSNTQTAIAHAISYYITSYKGIPHGLACSFTLPLLVDNIIGKYDFIDDALKEIFSELSSKKLRALFSELNISTKFSDYGIFEKEFAEIKESLKSNQRANNSLVSLEK